MNEEVTAAAPAAPAGGPPSRRRFAALYLLVPMLALASIALPLARGGETLMMRDVLNAHLAMKWSEAVAFRQGYFPLLDPYRGGGQPLAGNPNAVPFYPTNVLLLWASPFWALNAHFWIHLLLAPFAFFWLARRWGLSREAAWAAGVCYAVSGFYLSHLSFYNMIAGATLAPALVAACLGFAAPEASTGAGRRRALYAPAIAVLWGLLLLGGEPLLAALAGCLAAAAMLSDFGWAGRGPARAALPAGVASAEDAAAGAEDAVTAAVPAEAAPGRAWPRRGLDAARGLPPRLAAAGRRAWRRAAGWRPAWGAWGLLAGAVACGVLLALPQIVEFLRILPVSFRGFKGYQGGVATIASWDPRQSAEWLLPMVFGRLDVRLGGNFWGQRFYTGAPPFFPSLYPGLLALALVAAAGRPRCRAAWWAWGAVAAGLFCSLGRFNPAMVWLFEHAGAGALRYPVKFWLPAAVGAGLLCGLGFERLTAAPDVPGSAGRAAARRRFFWTLAGLGLLIGALWLVLNVFPAQTLRVLRLLIPRERTDAFVANERVRWSGLCMFSVAVLALVVAAARRMVRSPRAAWAWGGLLLAVHAVAQIWLLRPLYPTDAVAPYRVPPPALAYLPREATIVNPDFEHLFGPGSLAAGKFPSPSLLWLERRAFYEMFPFAGPLWGRRYELNESPEGLDTYLTRMAQGVMSTASDEERLHLLAAWGVGRVVLERALTPLPVHARLLATLPSFGQRLYIYEVTGRMPEVFLARRVWQAPSMTMAYRMMKNSAFEPATDVVMPGDGPKEILPGGTVRVLREGPERLDLDVEAGSGGAVLVVQRARLLYRATIDGRPASLEDANICHNGLAVPAGRHRVRMWVDRTNFHLSLALAGLGLAALPLLSAWAWRDAGRRAPPGTIGARS
jgi:hypothetical protein